MTEPYKFQKRGILKMERFRCRALLADEMGLGKTLQVLWLLKRNPELNPCVIVCPATLKWVWEDQAKEHINRPAMVLSGRTPYREEQIPYHPKINVINYEILPYWVDYIEKIIKPNLLVIEECHYISNGGRLAKGKKNAGVARTSAVFKLAKSVKHVIGISGTPLIKRPRQLYNIVHLINPNLFPSYPAYAFRYCARKRGYRGWDDSGASHLKELHGTLAKHMLIRRKKKDVLTELPDKVFRTIPLDMKDRGKYDRQKRKIDRWFKEISKQKIPHKRSMKAKGLMKLSRLLSTSSKLKIPAALKWLDDFLIETDEKIVLVCHHVNIVKMVQDKYKDKCLAIYGAVKVKERRHTIRAFQTQKKYRIMIINQAGAEGITLSAANNVVLLELFWTPGLLNQFIDRVHRIGQDKTVFVHFLVARGTLEEQMCKSLQKSSHVVSEVLDGGTTGDEFNLYNQYVQARSEL